MPSKRPVALERDLTIEEQIAELLAAGWKPLNKRVWKAPVGGYYLGPHGAWKAMRARLLKKQGSHAS